MPLLMSLPIGWLCVLNVCKLTPDSQSLYLNYVMFTAGITEKIFIVLSVPLKSILSQVSGHLRPPPRLENHMNVAEQR